MRSLSFAIIAADPERAKVPVSVPLLERELRGNGAVVVVLGQLGLGSRLGAALA